MGRTVDELIRIAATGAGFTINAKDYALEHLVQIAAAVSEHGGKVHITGAQMEPTQNLIRIAQAGKGCVSFDL